MRAIAVVILTLLFFPVSWSISPQSKDASKPATKPPDTPPVKEEPKDAQAHTPLKADADFSKKYREFVSLQDAVAEIEQKNGVTALREQQQSLLTEMRQWMADHKVQGWDYDDSTQTFTPKKMDAPVAEKSK